MDKLVFGIPERIIPNKEMVVKIDAEAAAMPLDIAGETGLRKKYILSEMVKFSYPRIEVRHVTLSFKDADVKKGVR